MPSLDSITFDTTGLIPQGDMNGVRVWQTPEGNGLGLYYFPIPPDISADINSLASLNSFYGSQMAAANLTGISIKTLDIDECKFIKMIVRVPQQPLGMMYIGSLTLPFRDFSFVVKMQCSESGITGMRESLILNELLENGEVEFDNKSDEFEGWEMPLGTVNSPSWRINRAEAVEYDARFPNHPLSILRRTFDQIEKSIKVSDNVKREPRFSYPENGG